MSLHWDTLHFKVSSEENKSQLSCEQTNLDLLVYTEENQEITNHELQAQRDLHNLPYLLWEKLLWMSWGLYYKRFYSRSLQIFVIR
jgi:hypothetical protein